MRARWLRRLARGLAALVALTLPALTVNVPPAAASAVFALYAVDPNFAFPGTPGSIGTGALDVGGVNGVPVESTCAPPYANGAVDCSGYAYSYQQHIVRTNDQIVYQVAYANNSGTSDAVDAVVSSTLPSSSIGSWVLPSGQCPGPAGATIVGNTLTCDLGPVAAAVSGTLNFTLKVAATNANGTQITPTFSIHDAGDAGAATVTTSGYYEQGGLTETTPYDVVTAAFKQQLVKQLYGSPTYTFTGEGGVPGYYMTYRILVQQGTGVPGSATAFGSTPLPNGIVFTDSFSDNVAGALSNTVELATSQTNNGCDINGVGKTLSGQPLGNLGLGNQNTAVVNSGTFTCTQTGAGQPITITINGADTSGSSYPSGFSSATLVISGYITVFVPLLYPAPGGSLSDAYSQMTAGGQPVPSDPNQTDPQHQAGANLPNPLPPVPTANSGKTFYADANNTVLPNNGIVGTNGSITPSQEIVASMTTSNTSTPATGDASMTNVIGCEDLSQFPNQELTPIAFDATTNPSNLAVAGGAGGAVIITSPAAGFTAQYATNSFGAGCADGAATWVNFSGSVPAGITKIRVRGGTLAPAPSASQTLTWKIAFAVSPTIASSPILQQYEVLANTSQVTADAPFAGGSATGKVQVQNMALRAPAKAFYGNTSGGSLPSTSPPGGLPQPGEVLNPGQTFYSGLDTDGTIGSAPTANVTVCDFVDATNFSLVPGPGNNPVSLTTLFGSGATIQSITFSKTSAATFAGSFNANGDDCSTGTFDSLATAQGYGFAGVERVKVVLTINAYSKVRTYLAEQVVGLPPAFTTVYNGMVQSVGGVDQYANTSANLQHEMAYIVRPTGTFVADPGSSVVSAANANDNLIDLQGYLLGSAGTAGSPVYITDTLPKGVTYTPGSATFVGGSASPQWNGQGSATPTITNNGDGTTTLTWNVGNYSAAPGVYITTPKITYQATVALSEPPTIGPPLNLTATIADPLDPNASPNHTANATLQINGSGSFNAIKAANNVLAPGVGTIDLGGTIQFSLQFANSSAMVNGARLDIIDVLPYNGDSRDGVRHSSFNGTLTFVSATTAVANTTFFYTSKNPAQIDYDPGCSSNAPNGGDSPGNGCTQPANSTVWCGSIGGGAACPATAAAVTAVRLVSLAGFSLPAGTTGSLTINTQTTANAPADVYYNRFTANQDLGPTVTTKATETTVVTPLPYLTLVKSCSYLMPYPSGFAGGPCPATHVPPQTIVQYSIVYTNTGNAGASGHPASQVAITDPVPANTDFQINSMADTVPGAPSTLTFVFQISTDGVTYTTVSPPNEGTSGGGGANPGFDRTVRYVRWLGSGTLSNLAPTNTGTVSFGVQVR